MDTNERTQDVFEQIDAYPKPPLIPLPEPNDFSSLAEMGLKPTPIAFSITKTTLALTGFKSFEKQLPNRLEDLLRKSNLRGAGLFSLIISASLALKDDTRELTPSERAATLLFGARSLHDDLWAGTLPPDKYKDQILEMGQYPNLFSTSLIVEGKGARLYKSKNTGQITVLIGGRLYVLDVGHLGKDTSISQLTQTLEAIRKAAQENPRPEGEPPAGILTNASHATQVPIFFQLQQNETNRENLHLLRHSFLTLCLDLDDKPSSYAEAAKLAQSANLENRWQHASLQIVVFGNSKAVVLCNFNAYVDGNTMMRGAAEIQKRAAQTPLDEKISDDDKKTIQIKELSWEIPSEFIQKARKDIDWVTDDQQATFEIPIGSEEFTSRQVRPVPAFIAALQMTALKLTGEMANISQFLTMSRYRCMDLATANVSTPEMVRFVEYMQGEDVQRQQAQQLLMQAIESQARVAREARADLRYSKMLALYLFTKKGFSRTFTSLAIAFSMLLLRILGLFKQPQTDIVVSHPGIFEEVPIVGRPGIRLPYVKYFGLHYQIMMDKTVVTMMPAVNWQVPNQQLIEELQRNLEKVLWVISG